MYLNDITYKKLEESFLLFENIFSIKAWTKEHEKDIKQASDVLRNESQKEIQKGIEIFKKNYKEDYEFIKFHNIPFFTVADTFEKFKKLYTVFHKIDSKFSHYSASEIYKELKKFGPVTIVAEIDEKHSKKKFNKKDKIYDVPFIVIPEPSFFEKLFLKGDLLGYFMKPSWIELEKQISIYHESIEFNEYANKRFHLGNFYLKADGDFYKYGNHYSIFVLAKEAIVLNKFKHLAAAKVLRDYRKRYEWKIIKAKTGVDFSKLSKLTPEIVKKLEKVKPEKFGDEEGLFIDVRDLKKYSFSKIEKPFKNNIQILKKFKFYKLK